MTVSHVDDVVVVVAGLQTMAGLLVLHHVRHCWGHLVHQAGPPALDEALLLWQVYELTNDPGQ